MSYTEPKFLKASRGSLILTRVAITFGKKGRALRKAGSRLFAGGNSPKNIFALKQQGMLIIYPKIYI